ncbi:unnamed protein product [Phytomonas sp. EM1]|nr:unnamed protein product [Phytomonas sp. EM1]|eukprot:CCW64237.1 unnamed protein product [Phytomonas sp. isolate EM1]
MTTVLYVLIHNKEFPSIINEVMLRKVFVECLVVVLYSDIDYYCYLIYLSIFYLSTSCNEEKVVFIQRIFQT